MVRFKILKIVELVEFRPRLNLQWHAYKAYIQIDATVKFQPVPIYFSERNFLQFAWLGSLWSWKPHYGEVS